MQLIYSEVAGNCSGKSGFKWAAGGLKKIAAAESCCCSFFCFCVHAVMYAT